MSFTVIPAAPTITSFNPVSGAAQDAIVITGTNLTSTISVKFNGVPAALTVDSDTQITATLPTGCSSGLIEITTNGGTVSSLSGFTVTVPGGGTNGNSGTAITIFDEGNALTSATTSINFVGSGVQALNEGNVVTVNIPGGGESDNKAQWQLKSSNYPALSGDKILANMSNKVWQLKLPSPAQIRDEVEVIALNANVNRLEITNINKFQGYQIDKLILNDKFTGGKLIYVDETYGWIQSPSSKFIPIGSLSDLNYQFDGDTNGVFYLIGTNRLSSSWSNPHLSGNIRVFASSVLSGFPSLDAIVDRQPSLFHTNNESNPFVGFDLLADKKLKINYWSYKSREPGNDFIPNRLILSASDDGSTYQNISDKSFSIGQNYWVSFPVENQKTFYRYFKFTLPYSGYFTVGEFELYGQLNWALS